MLAAARCRLCCPFPSRLARTRVPRARLAMPTIDACLRFVFGAARVSINGDLQLRTHGAEKKSKTKSELPSLSIHTPHGFSHPLPGPLLSSLASTHTTHPIVLIGCVQCVELKESILACRGSLQAEIMKACATKNKWQERPSSAWPTTT